MQTIRSACTADCPDACGLLVDSDGERVHALRGDPEHPITRGFVCYRARRHVDRLRDPERLTSPRRRRSDGSWQEIGWDEALDIAATGLQRAIDQAGPESVVFLRSGGSMGLGKHLVDHFFHLLGPVTTASGGVCGEAGEAAQEADFGDVACHDFGDLEHSRSVVLWGKDACATGPHLIPFLKAAAKRGAPVALIEVLPTQTARLADRVIRIAPSGDGFLALAVLRMLNERDRLDPTALERVENHQAFRRLLESEDASVARCARAADVARADIEYLAELYGEQRPVATWIGWGLQRRLTGGRNVRWVDALALASGNVGVPGGGANYSSTRRRGLDVARLARPSGRTVRSAHLGEDLLALRDPHARFVYVAMANPVTQFPDSSAIQRALRKAELVVVADAFMTDTARAADLVLPVSLMLEQDEVVGSFQHHHIAVSRRAVAPPPSARDDVWVVRQLRSRLDIPADPLLEEPAAELARMTRPWFGGELSDAPPRRNPTQEPVPFADGFPTPSGKATLVTELPELTPSRDGFPLVFVTPPSRLWQTSQLTEREQRGRLVECSVHPQAAGVDGRPDGATAILVSPLGTALEVSLRLDERMRRDVCVVHRGGAVFLGRGVNTLVEARQTDLGGGAAFHDQRVRLE